MNKKIKITMIVVFLIVAAFLLSSCSKMDDVPKPAKEEELSSFMIYESYYNGSILVDRDTHVMYWMSLGTYNCGNLTMLVESDGSPKLWDGESNKT